jgi:hypothetical protein
MQQQPRWIWLLIATTTLLVALLWFGTLQQPLIDAHEFRQTQTALSALFMQPGLEGLLRYETPVAGPQEVFRIGREMFPGRRLAAVNHEDEDEVGPAS